MIHAINRQGREATFSEKVWETMAKDKNGWVEFSQQGEVLVPQQIIEFQQKKLQEVAVVGTDEPSKQPQIPTDETPKSIVTNQPEPPKVMPVPVKATKVKAKVDSKKKPLKKVVKR